MKTPSVTDLQRKLEAEFIGRLDVPGSEVPRVLDFAVLAAARRASAARRRMRWLRRFSPFAAAAAMLLVFGIFQYRQSSPAPASGGDEALALLDWSKVEQEAYNLSSELNSRQLTMSQWN
ncbi:MAG: hypothetical protein AB7F32_07695 [Victivallaceae bacterium]